MSNNWEGYNINTSLHTVKTWNHIKLLCQSWCIVRIIRKQRIDELGLSHTAYYYTRGLLSEEELHGRLKSGLIWGGT